MSRDYFAVFTRLFRDPKYRKLTDSQRVTLFTLWGIAGDESPEATWQDREWLGRLLQLHERPPDDVAVLIEAGWLDRLEDGAIAVHDWDEWQMAGSERIKKDWEAARVREWRRSKKKPNAPDESESEIRGDEMRGVRTTYVHPFAQSWRSKGLSRPSQKQEDLLDSLVQRYGQERMVQELEAMPVSIGQPSQAIEYLLERVAA